MPNPVLFKANLEEEAVKSNNLEVSFFFTTQKGSTGADEIFPRGAILSKNGAKITAIKLIKNSAELARADVNLPSPVIAAAFPRNPHSANSGFLIRYDIAKSLGTYALVVSIEGQPDVIIARPVTRAGRGPFDVHREQRAHPDIFEEDFWTLAAGVWPHTMLEVAVLYNAYSSARYVMESGIPGDLIECGVFHGGVIMMLEEMCLRYDKSNSRRVFAMDTFDGFPSVDSDRDIVIRTGKAMSGTRWVDFFEHASANMRSVNFPRLNIVRGDVMKTIPTVDVEKIALLRLDTDTYETTKFELEQFYDRVSIGGVVIIDDYGFTIGCREAVEEFRVGRGIYPQRINDWSRAWVKVRP